MAKKCRIACVVGTRPEIIKMAPLVFELNASDWAEVTLINTAQHRQLLDEMLDVFQLKVDIDFNVMSKNQSLGALSGELCQHFETLFNTNAFDVILAVGDTTTVFISSLLAFYHRIPFGHIEAGLRTEDRYHPFPEEMNRRLTAVLATWHFAPTPTERLHLLHEGVCASNIYVTGNPVIDALYWVRAHQRQPSRFRADEQLVTVTTHRRESFGEGLAHICEAILTLSERFPALHFKLPVHPNPHVQEAISARLKHHPNIELLQPMRYDAFIELLQASMLVMTDSGGIQEEAPALGTPVIIMRDTTERELIIQEELGLLAGTDCQRIVDNTSRLLTDKALYARMSRGFSPYGDGKSAQAIAQVLKAHWQEGLRN